MDSSYALSSLFDNYVVHEDSTMDAIERITSDSSREPRAFFHMSVDELVRRVKLWHLAMPRVVPHYAVKCNDHPAVIKTLSLLDIGFDCASRAEINKVVGIGVDPSRIIFAHPCKIASHIKHARAQGVKQMTFDSIEELKKIHHLYPEAELVLRIRCDSKNVRCQLGLKFGVLPVEAPPLLRFAAELGLSVVGVAFHVGSGCCEPAVFTRAISAAKQVFLDAEAAGHHPVLLDIGGGFLGECDDSLHTAAEYINAALDQHFPEGNGYRIIAEPGRYFVAAAFTLATVIVNRRDMRQPARALVKCGNDAAAAASHDPRASAAATAAADVAAAAADADLDIVMYFMDDGLYGSFNGMLYENQHKVPRLLKPDPSSELCISSVWGPTCDSIDQVVPAVLLPKSLRVGDWLIWTDMGAYSLSAGTNFNGFSVPEVIVHMRSHTRRMLEAAVSSREVSDGSSGVSSDEEGSVPSTPPSHALTPFFARFFREAPPTSGWPGEPVAGMNKSN